MGKSKNMMIRWVCKFMSHEEANEYTPAVASEIRIERGLPTGQIVLIIIVTIHVSIIVALVFVNAVVVPGIERPIVHQAAHLLVFRYPRRVGDHAVAVIPHTSRLVAAADRAGPAEVIAELCVQEGGQWVHVAGGGVGALRGGRRSGPGGRRLVQPISVGVVIVVSGVLDAAVGSESGGVESTRLGGGLVQHTVRVRMRVGVVCDAAVVGEPTADPCMDIVVREMVRVGVREGVRRVGLFVGRWPDTRIPGQSTCSSRKGR